MNTTQTENNKMNSRANLKEQMYGNFLNHFDSAKYDEFLEGIAVNRDRETCPIGVAKMLATMWMLEHTASQNEGVSEEASIGMDFRFDSVLNEPFWEGLTYDQFLYFAGIYLLDYACQYRFNAPSVANIYEHSFYKFFDSMPSLVERVVKQKQKQKELFDILQKGVRAYDKREDEQASRMVCTASKINEVLIHMQEASVWDTDVSFFCHHWTDIPRVSDCMPTPIQMLQVKKTIENISGFSSIDCVFMLDNLFENPREDKQATFKMKKRF